MAKKAKAKRRSRRSKRTSPLRGLGSDARQLITSMKSYHQGLVRHRTALDTEISAVAQAIEALGAPSPGAPARRRRARRRPLRRGNSLKEFIGKVLAASAKPMTVKDLGSRVVKAGYKTKSKNLGNQISMALAQMRKVKQVKKVSRGMYKA